MPAVAVLDSDAAGCYTQGFSDSEVEVLETVDSTLMKDAKKA